MSSIAALAALFAVVQFERSMASRCVPQTANVAQYLFSFIVIHPLRFRLVHLVFAAFRAICFRRLAETVFILTFADLRPRAAKYSDSFLSIILALYPKPLSIMKQQLSGYWCADRN